MKKEVVKSSVPDFDFMSEEVCEYCEEIFDTNTIRTRCPDCGEIIVSCNACDNIACDRCEKGSAFNLYGIERTTPVDEIEKPKEHIPWFDGGGE